MNYESATMFVAAVLFASILGCQSSDDPTESASPTQPEAQSSPAAMKLVVMTDAYNSQGESQDQQIDSADATPDLLATKLNEIDWEHATNRYHIALSAGAGSNSSDRKKLSISQDTPEGTKTKLITAKLEETPPGGTSEKIYTVESLESPELVLRLLESFLAQNGEYRTMVNWQEQ